MVKLSPGRITSHSSLSPPLYRIACMCVSSGKIIIKKGKLFNLINNCLQREVLTSFFKLNLMGWAESGVQSHPSCMMANSYKRQFWPRFLESFTIRVLVEFSFSFNRIIVGREHKRTHLPSPIAIEKSKKIFYCYPVPVTS